MVYPGAMRALLLSLVIVLGCSATAIRPVDAGMDVVCVPGCGVGVVCVAGVCIAATDVDAGADAGPPTPDALALHCAAGMTVSCGCPGAGMVGTQTCDPASGAFGLCACPDAGHAADTGTDGQGEDTGVDAGVDVRSPDVCGSPTDPMNCGRCGVTCGSYPLMAVCVAGACVACPPSGMAACNNVCTDPQTDNANCGRCGAACTPPFTCQHGECL